MRGRARGRSPTDSGSPDRRSTVRVGPVRAFRRLPRTSRARDNPRGPVDFPSLGLRLTEPTAGSGAVVYRLSERRPGAGRRRASNPTDPADRGGLEIGMVITDAADRQVDNARGLREGAGRTTQGPRPLAPHPPRSQGRSSA